MARASLVVDHSDDLARVMQERLTLSSVSLVLSFSDFARSEVVSFSITVTRVAVTKDSDWVHYLRALADFISDVRRCGCAVGILRTLTPGSCWPVGNINEE